MKIRCMIIDDEPLAIKLIENHISNFNELEVVATTNNAISGLEMLQTNQVDLLFCDIKMPKVSGIDLIKTLHDPPQVILTTAHREFAIEGYELDVIDYLLKPITFERFSKSIEKYLRLHQVEFIDPQIQPLTIKKENLTLKYNNKYYKIKVDDILYVESQRDYLKFYLLDQIIISKYKISELELELDPDSFLRIHRSYMVNLKHVNSFSMAQVEVNKKELPIGALYREQVISILNK